MHIAGEVLKNLLATFQDKVDGQQAIADKKAEIIYAALEAYPSIYRVRLWESKLLPLLTMLDRA